MKVMYIGPKYYDGKVEAGLGYEHYNFYGTLNKMKNIEVVYFPYDEMFVKYGKEKMNNMLVNEVFLQKPDICFFFTLRNEISKETIKKISSSNKTVTLNWFGDDHNRFDSYSRFYAPLFNWSATTDQLSVEKYHKIGYNNIIKTQWGCNNFIYGPMKNNKDKDKYSVSFVGQRYNLRSYISDVISEAGFDIQCFGRGWPNGRISQNQMLKIFSQSKINLNITKTQRRIEPRFILGIFLREEIDKRITINSPTEWPHIFRSLVANPRAQIKGRTFEIPGCEEFMLTQYVDGLDEYYREGKEIAVFKNNNELLNKIRYYLDNDKERRKVAKAGYIRTIKEHTYEKRFRKLFKQIGF